MANSRDGGQRPRATEVLQLLIAAAALLVNLGRLVVDLI